MRRALAIALFVSCGVTQPERAFTRTDSILASSADLTTTSVFVLDLRYNNGRAGICTATLISPRVLVTAGHCIDPSREGASSVTVAATNEPDDSMLMASDFIQVTKLARHPQYSGEGGHDLGLLLLASAPVGVTPKPLVRTPPSSWVGQSLRLVGYGRSSVSLADSGTRRSASVTVTVANAEALEFGSAGSSGICAGDSGGAGFATFGGVEQLAGVHSYGKSSQCGVGGDIRIDTNLTFIDSFLTENDPPTCASDARCKEGCTPVDVDCPKCLNDGRCDVGCATPDPDCPRCVADARCDSSCTSDPDCNTACGEPDDGLCTEGCVSDPECKGDGDICEREVDCVTRICTADSRGYSFCSRACTDTSRCLREMICEEGFCRIPKSAVEPGDGADVRGGCSSSPTSAASTGLLLLLLAARGRRRSRSRSRPR